MAGDARESFYNQRRINTTNLINDERGEGERDE